MFVRVNLAMAHERVRIDVQKNEMTKKKLKNWMLSQQSNKKAKGRYDSMQFS